MLIVDDEIMDQDQPAGPQRSNAGCARTRMSSAPNGNYGRRGRPRLSDGAMQRGLGPVLPEPTE
jgi:hypothetical protein